MLAKEEITAEIKKAGRGAGMMGGGALAGWIAALLLSFALAWGLAALFDEAWLGFLVVGVIWGVTAAWLFLSGRRQLQEVEPLAEQTIEEHWLHGRSNSKPGQPWPNFRARAVPSSALAD
jgi:cobalamin biosynthesis protein CobD/CbiB